MAGDRTEPKVVNNTGASQFQTEVDGQLAVAGYRLGEGLIEFTHTQVPAPLEGRGVGSALARAGLEHARSQGLQVVPTCTFIRSYIDRHAEYQDLVKR